MIFAVSLQEFACKKKQLSDESESVSACSNKEFFLVFFLLVAIKEINANFLSIFATSD